jgi:hypothetical protein
MLDKGFSLYIRLFIMVENHIMWKVDSPLIFNRFISSTYCRTTQC